MPALNNKDKVEEIILIKKNQIHVDVDALMNLKTQMDANQMETWLKDRLDKAIHDCKKKSDNQKAEIVLSVDDTTWSPHFLKNNHGTIRMMENEYVTKSFHDNQLFIGMCLSSLLTCCLMIVLFVI